MRKLFIPVIAFASIAMVSCGETETKEEEKKGEPVVVDDKDPMEINLTGLREFDMSPYDLNVVIYVPEKFRENENQEQVFLQPDIEHHDGEAEWTITMKGEKNFNLVLVDWGDVPQSVVDEKARHADNSNIYTFIYNEEGEDFMLFSRVLNTKNTTLDQEDMKDLPSHHFYAVKEINGYYIIGKSNSMNDFYQVSARKMMNCVRAIKASPKV
jgi:uncharacterized protein YrzB (UPF0473 family)